MRETLFPYCKLRRKTDGTIRPRFEPSAREIALGFTGQDLKHSDGKWFTLDQVAAYAREKHAEILAARKTGQLVTRSATLEPRPLARRTVADLLDAYLASPDFTRLGARSQRDYRGKADAIRYKRRPLDPETLKPDRKAPRIIEPIAITPAKEITPAIVKGFYEYLNAERGGAMARSTIMVLSAAFAWARLAQSWEIRPNPCHDLNLPTPAPRVVVFTIAEIKALIAAADAAHKWSIGDAIVIALFSGQREGDVLALVDKAGTTRTLAERTTEGEPLRFVQAKTGARVAAFAGRYLVKRLQEAEDRRRARKVVSAGDVPIVLSEATAEAWNEHTFRHDFRRVRSAAAKTVPSIEGKQFRDLRDTAVTWLANAGCTLPEICAITGHSLESATTILKHYLELGEPLARQAMTKMLAWMDGEGMAL